MCPRNALNLGPELSMKIGRRFHLAALAVGGAVAAAWPSVTAAQIPEEDVALNGTRLTFYPRPSAAQCQTECAANSQCQGSTWIRAGTYNPADPAMCYLMSAVTGKSTA